MTISPEILADYYRQACEAELSAFKPGNVSIYADGHDMTVQDFKLSAKVSAEPLCNPHYSLGEKIYYAVKATREAVGCNTNLGIILLCAPLIEATKLININVDLRQAVHTVLRNTTLSDADWTFKAIALASPAGLGESGEHDVHQGASVTLTEAMAFASEKDRIALQYVTDYQDIFDFCYLTYCNALTKWGSRDWAVVMVYVDYLRHFPDSHILRKYDKHYCEKVSKQMAQLYHELNQSAQPEQLLKRLYQLDKALKAENLNPGTTADITVATVLTALLSFV
jgi:triphosphoribosyl-dephospho-CoA synthase